MSSQKTERYQLHKWESGDDFLRQEFNENFERLDEALGAHDATLAGQAAAIAGKADGAATSAALAKKAEQSAVNAALDAIPKVRWGQYQGTQASGNSTPQDIYLGYRPRLLLLMPDDGSISSSGIRYGCFLLDGQSDPYVPLTFTDVGFRVQNVSNNHYYLNSEGKTYTYLVLS